MKREGYTSAFYFVSEKGTNPPSYSDAQYNHIVDFLESAQLVTNYKNTYSTVNVGEWIEDDNDKTTSNKKRRTTSDEIQGLNVNEDEINNDVLPNSTPTIAPQQKIESLPPSTPVSYWTSPEAAQLFRHYQLRKTL